MTNDYFGESLRGTGSYPLVPQGWHREMRFMPSHIPLKGPHSEIASIVYCEHEGVWRQCVPRSGDSVSWYKRMGRMNIFLRMFGIVIPYDKLHSIT